jgi:cellulose synthase/poly-beta-1,6-N-acetylglucosamine synthase-like glycosyltransferase
MSEQSVLPAFPAVRREPVLKKRDYLSYVPLTLITVGVIASFLVSWLSAADQSYNEVPFWVVTFLLLYYFSITILRLLLLPCMSRPLPMPVSTRWRVGVATTFVPGLESLEMLDATGRALVAMRYPHDTWVLDEGADPRVAGICERIGARYFSRKGVNHYQTERGTFERRTKHGNYNAWLDAHGYDAYDVIVSFDPDHVPDVRFLETALGYLEDPKIGYVQLPQAYYNQRAGFIARGAAEETYDYYATTQMSSYTFGFPIVIGCHNVHRADALRQVGGFAAHDADDLLITLLYRSAGWQGVYVPEIRARGLTPTDWPAYLCQQWRWARSVLDIKLRAFPRVAGRLPLQTRLMSFMHGFYYVKEGVTALASVLLLVFMLATGSRPTFLSFSTLPSFLLVALVITMTDFYRQRFLLDWRREWGLHFRSAFLRFVKWPYVVWGLVEAIAGAKHPYSVTPKVRRGPKKTLMTSPHLVVCVLILTASLIGIVRGTTPHPLLLMGAGLIFVSSLTAVWTETWKFPAPFDAKLLAEVQPDGCDREAQVRR